MATRRRTATSPAPVPPTTGAGKVGQGGGVGATFDVGHTMAPPLPPDLITPEVLKNGRVTQSPPGGEDAGGTQSTRVDSAKKPPKKIGEALSEQALEKQRAEAAARAKLAHLELCRTDVNAFIEYVLVDEETGKYLEQAPLHVKMQRAMDLQTPGYLKAANDDEELKPEEKGGARLVVMAHPESGKTNQLGVGRVLWLLGKNPNLRLVLLGNVQGGAKKTLSVIKRYIENGGGKTGCTRLREVFPELLPSKQLWTADQIVVKRTVTSKDPTIQCIGYHGAIVGSRVDGVVADDLLDYEVTRNENARKELSSWWTSSVMSRLTARAWVVFLTNAWHPFDLAHELEKKGWETLRFPVLNEEGKPTWAERWPLWRINSVRTNDFTELEFARAFLCKPRDDGAITFLPEALELCKRKGRGYGLQSYFPDEWMVEGSMLVHGVDLAATRKMTGAVSCIFSIYFHPNGMRQPVSIRSGRWSAREILMNLADVGDAFGGVAVVEDNGTQRYLVDIAQEAGEELGSIQIPVLPFTTGKNKIDPMLGIDSMAAEFEAGRWIVPVGAGVYRNENLIYLPDREVRLWLEEMAIYDPATHAGDRLMASWMARTWAMRRMRRMKQAREGVGGVRVTVLDGNGRRAA